MILILIFNFKERFLSKNIFLYTGYQDEDIDFLRLHSTILSENFEYFSQRRNRLQFLSQGNECNICIEESFPCSMIQNSILSNEEFLFENHLKNYSSYEKPKDKIYEFNAVCFDEHAYCNDNDDKIQGFNKDVEMGQSDHDKIESCANYSENENLTDEGCRKSKKSMKANESEFNT
ncbi:hypothetical protein SteCoe_37989 [Stentor coeruleus]|uniref:Uncharacterized protein n=1 Tax=Stentor coeruleus TaxID=5963 RepID=A0A1R2AM26_9CILI|nr:hypothetical protein SteCoe_37989 [Stentor coeruleus]